MRILVIDDQPYNVASAHLTLKGYDYKVVDKIEAAYETLKTETFDVVLTDLWLPRGEFKGATHGDDPPTMPIPAGLVFAIRAANAGSRVVICTDSNHHQDILISVLDLIEEGVWGKEKAISFIEARTCPVEGVVMDDGQIVLCDDYWRKPGPRAKNWLVAMRHAGIIPVA